ncbi:MAG: hypothetical protein A4E30_01411 [Methanomassiliicoccales archaeon PtaB.Bin215]|nr:MAG: hypothetical protein A4E30_01411 [Methanomassiliicoccales archaeon PtaB.Bin215]
MAAPAGVPVRIGLPWDRGVVHGYRAQCGIDGLLLRADEPDLHLSFHQGEDLGSQHGRVGDADQLELALIELVAGDNEEPRTVRGAVYVGPLDGLVEGLLVLRQGVEVPFGGGCQRLDYVFERIAIRPIEQIEQEHRYLGVREEQGHDVLLRQIFAHRMIVGEVAVVDQSLVQAHEGMRPARVPHPALGGIPLMSDPDVGGELLQPIEPYDVLGVADHLHDDHVPAMGHDEGLHTLLDVEAVVDGEAGLVDVLVLGLPGVHASQAALLHERR